MILYHNGMWADNIMREWNKELSSDYKKVFPFISILGIFAFIIKRF
jgi:hypothetical protein